jgi:hypothetical protein
MVSILTAGIILRFISIDNQMQTIYKEQETEKWKILAYPFTNLLWEKNHQKIQQKWVRGITAFLALPVYSTTCYIATS